jgi:hypothetical protein
LTMENPFFLRVRPGELPAPEGIKDHDPADL